MMNLSFLCLEFTHPGCLTHTQRLCKYNVCTHVHVQKSFNGDVGMHRARNHGNKKFPQQYYQGD